MDGRGSEGVVHTVGGEIFAHRSKPAPDTEWVTAVALSLSTNAKVDASDRERTGQCRGL